MALLLGILISLLLGGGGYMFCFSIRVRNQEVASGNKEMEIERQELLKEQHFEQ